MSDISVKAKVAAYLLLNKEIEDRKTLQADLKKELEPYLLAADKNTRGSHVIKFAEPLEIHGTRYKELQRLRKESRVLNEERVLAYLHDKEYNTGDDSWLYAVDTVERVNTDELWSMFVQDLITQEELDSFYDVTESWAFAPTKE